MIEDCRADKPAGWSYFLKTYTPVMRRWLAHYCPGADLDRILPPVKQAVAAMEPGPERPFLCELRQAVVAAAESGDPVERGLDLETLSSALEPLTVIEKQAVCLELMGYPDADAARMLRMDGATVAKMRDKAADLMRSRVDTWRRTLIAECGPALRRAIAGARSAECYPPKTFFDFLDGRTNWYARGELGRHVVSCWFCIDHFCRCREVSDSPRA